MKLAIRTWPMDAYHPHYPSIDGDYYQRLHDRAGLMANSLRLSCRVYTDSEEVVVAEAWKLLRTKD